MGLEEAEVAGSWGSNDEDSSVLACLADHDIFLIEHFYLEKKARQIANTIKLVF